MVDSAHESATLFTPALARQTVLLESAARDEKEQRRRAGRSSASAAALGVALDPHKPTTKDVVARAVLAAANDPLDCCGKVYHFHREFAALDGHERAAWRELDVEHRAGLHEVDHPPARPSA